MSVTLNFAGKVKREVIVSCCCGGEKDCYSCKGTGLETVNELELNMSNGNFHHIFSCLGLDACYFNPGELMGQISAQKLFAACVAYRPGLGTRAEKVDGNIISCGLNEEQAMNRINKLKEIASAYIDEGMPNELISWA
jgi:hypothetical protein